MNSSKKSLKQQIKNLSHLVAQLEKTPNLGEKIAILNQVPLVQTQLECLNSVKERLNDWHPAAEYAVKSIMAIGQAPILFNIQKKEGTDTKLQQLIDQLLDLENFYHYLGGIIGYHVTVLKMIDSQSNPPSQAITYLHPEGLRLDQDTKAVRQTIKWGIENLPYVAEIFPVGGAGDRLKLTDPIDGTPLPAALLPFMGKSLLEGLICDHQAREYLYFKLYNKQLTTPIAMMTSLEKNNHSHILDICKRKQWFGRPAESFMCFTQPLVPVITVEGNWCMNAPLQLTLKPNGHGVIWKLAEEKGVLKWLSAHHCSKSLIRQINNPIAGTDGALLSLIGLGCHEKKAFGFISCERPLNSSEGTNVLIEKEISNGFEYCLTNIEYTDFAQKGIGESPLSPGSPYSTYPTNTNILFVDLNIISEAIEKCPVPGQLINFKSTFTYIDAAGKQSTMAAGRLESTMQNIADCIVDRFAKPLVEGKRANPLRTFIVYNTRRKTISTTKQSYQIGKSAESTPEQAYYDALSNNLQLLQEYCHFELPVAVNIEEHLKSGPHCIMTYHPALGPLYSIIAQKLRKGHLAKGALLQLDIAEVDIENLKVDGSLIIEATCPLGQYNAEGLLQYGQESRCRLQDVCVNNQGIDWSTPNCFWKSQITYLEKLHIFLHEGAEFDAEGVKFEGNFYFEVPPHHCLKIRQNEKGQLIEDLQLITSPSWQWHYAFDAEDFIKLNMHAKQSY